LAFLSDDKPSGSTKRAWCVSSRIPMGIYPSICVIHAPARDGMPVISTMALDDDVVPGLRARPAILDLKEKRSHLGRLDREASARRRFCVSPLRSFMSRPFVLPRPVQVPASCLEMCSETRPCCHEPTAMATPRGSSGPTVPPSSHSAMATLRTTACAGSRRSRAASLRTGFRTVIAGKAARALASAGDTTTG